MGDAIMPGTKILWGQVFAVFGFTLGGIWGATQWVAYELAFQPELGRPWFAIGGLPIYPPPAFFWWWFAFDAYAPDIFATGALVAVSGTAGAIVIAIGMSIWRARELKKAETYGSARWATLREVAQAGMLGDNGVVLGKFEHRYLRHDGPEHVLCFAPTRSGKGVGLVVPSLLAWPGSVIVHDIKGENWQLTAGFRALHGRVLLFDPTNPQSNAYNPLLEVRRGEWEVRDVQNVADVLVDPEGSLEKRNHWEKTSHALLVGAILHVLYAENEKSLAGVAAFLSDPDRGIAATLHRMKVTRHLGEAGVHPVVAAAAQELLNKSENERSGVLSTAMSFLGLYRDPVIARVTGTSSWRISDLMAGPAPTSLYLVIPPGDISRTKPLIRLILNQIGRRLTEELNPQDRKQRLLFMLDEFPALGRLDFFESALAFMAGYGIKSFLIAQSLNQIEKAYGTNNAILDNCHVRVAFATNDERTAKRISDALGTATEMRAMKNYAGHRLSPWLGHLMVSRSETARALLTPGEVMQLAPDKEVVMVAGTPTIQAGKVRYYLDKRFRARILPPPAVEHTTAEHCQWHDWLQIGHTGGAPIATSTGGRGCSHENEANPSSDSGWGDANTAPSGVLAAQSRDSANGGIRREPGLGEHEEIVQARSSANEFVFDSSEPGSGARSRHRESDRIVSRIARNASLDPGDGIDV